MKADRHHNTSADLQLTADAILGTYNSLLPTLRTVQIGRIRTLMRMSFILGQLFTIREQEAFRYGEDD